MVALNSTKPDSTMTIEAKTEPEGTVSVNMC